MVLDSITEEIRKIRHELAARFDNDVHRIGANLRRQQEESNRPLIRLPPREPRHSGKGTAKPN
jgi:hypothetical protein